MGRSLLLGSTLLVAFSVLDPLGASQEFACPTTASSNPPQFFAPAPYPVNAPSPDTFWYGTADLWTMLRHDGRWGGLHYPGEGFYRNKLPIWRSGYDPRTEQRPMLTVTARRLDGPAPAVVVREASNAHSDVLGSMMMTAANIPAAGCWELTAHYRRQTLTFVVSVP